MTDKVLIPYDFKVNADGSTNPSSGGGPPLGELLWHDDFSSGSLSPYVLTGTPVIGPNGLTFGANQDCRITLTGSRILGTTKMACVIARCGTGIDNSQPGGNSRADLWINMNDVRFQLTNLAGLRFFNRDGSSFFPTNAAGSSNYPSRFGVPFWMRYIVFADCIQADVYNTRDPVVNETPLVTVPEYHGGASYSNNYVTSAAKNIITPQLRLNADPASGAPSPSNFWVNEWFIWSLDNLAFGAA